MLINGRIKIFLLFPLGCCCPLLVAPPHDWLRVLETFTGSSTRPAASLRCLRQDAALSDPWNSAMTRLAPHSPAWRARMGGNSPSTSVAKIVSQTEPEYRLLLCPGTFRLRATFCKVPTTILKVAPLSYPCKPAGDRCELLAQGLKPQALNLLDSGMIDIDSFDQSL